jgi:hypothetical protein
VSVEHEVSAEVHEETARVRGLAVRTTDLTRNLDIFLACAVAGVLGNRFFLVATGYPQVGNGTLHISHAIWGGLMLAVAVIFAVSFIAPGVRTFVAFLGGAGFGWFVDELGKFITRDVNYFFRPTLALIYSVFVVMYLAFRALERRRYRPEEALLNALEAVKAAALGRLDEPSRLHALALLDQLCTDEGLVPHVRSLLQQVPTVATPPPGRLNRFWLRVLGVYEGWTVRRGFGLAITCFFLTLGVFDVAQIVVIRTRYSSIHTVAQWATLVSSIFTLLFIIVGAVILPRARLLAFKWFEAAVLVSIFLTQVFLFAERQLAAVIDLSVAIVVWVALRSAIRLEVLARGIHDSYRERRLRTLGVEDPSVADWDSLPETLRASNRDQAAHFVEKLNLVGCGVVRSEGGAPVFTFTPAEVDTLAKVEHERWMTERRRQGWTPGPTRDPKARTTPYLVPWADLSEPVRDLDREAVREMPMQLARAGYAVVRL